MDDRLRLRSLEGAAQGRRVEDVRLEERRRAFGAQILDIAALERRIVELVEIVDERDLVPETQQPAGHVVTDETGTAGDQDAHAGILPSPGRRRRGRQTR